MSYVIFYILYFIPIDVVEIVCVCVCVCVRTSSCVACCRLPQLVIVIYVHGQVRDGNKGSQERVGEKRKGGNLLFLCVCVCVIVVRRWCC